MFKILSISVLLTLPTYSHDGEHSHVKNLTSRESAITGNGAFTFQSNHQWGKLPKGHHLGVTHGGVAIDSKGNIYVSNKSESSIVVFDKDGNYLKSIASHATWSHDIFIEEQDGKEFLYAAQCEKKNHIYRILKLDLNGKTVLEIPNKSTAKIPGGLSGLTGVTIDKSGNVYAAVGYGSSMIHKFSPEGKLLASFGGRSAKNQGIKNCHGIRLDTRYSPHRLLVADRENRRLVHFSLDGKWIGVHASSLRRPCSMAFHGSFTAVAELEGRVTILDLQGTPIAFLGDNPDKKQWANFDVKPDQVPNTMFSAPHGLTFDAEGNLYIQDWNASGRLTKLKKTSAKQ